MKPLKMFSRFISRSIEWHAAADCTWWATTVIRELSRLSHEGICPLVTTKMCRTQGACLSTERSE